MKARLVIADDHLVVRQGLRDIVSRTTDMEIVGEAADGEQAEVLARSGGADLMILDIALPGRRGMQVLESLRADGIRLPVMFFSMYSAAQYVDYARRAGAQGFVGKDASEADLLRVIRRILGGGASFPAKAGDATTAETEGGGDAFRTLSRREFEVMQLLVAGTSIIHIAETLGITTQSVTTYRRRLLEKLGVKSNVELATLVALNTSL